MKYIIKLLILVILYLKHVKGTFKYNEPIIMLIKTSKIYVNSNFGSIETLVKNDSVHNTMETFIPNNPNIVYTALKCEYAHIIVDILETIHQNYLFLQRDDTFLETDDLKLTWILKNTSLFLNFKINIVEIMYNLFELSDISQELKTNDLSLLKSMLAINLFFCYNKKLILYIVKNSNITHSDKKTLTAYDLHKTLQNIPILNESIVNMIGLINIFRYRKCEIEEPYNSTKIKKSLNSDEVIDSDTYFDALKSTVTKLKSLKIVKSVNYDTFDSKIYNTEYLLMSHLLAYKNYFIGNIKVLYKREKLSLISFYDNIYSQDTHDIDAIFVVQSILFRVITDVFYKQVHSLLKKFFEDQKYGIENLKKLRFNFNTFTSKIIPIVCLKNACEETVAIKLSLDDAIQYYETDKSIQLFETLQNQLETVFNPAFEYPKVNADFENYDPTLDIFIREITLKIPFKAFRQVYKLLSYESYSNKQYSIVDISDHGGKKISSDDGQTLFFQSINDLQSLLIDHSIFLTKNNKSLSNDSNTTDENQLGIPENFVSTEFGTLFCYLLMYIGQTFNGLRSRRDFQNILLPLLIHLYHTHQIYTKMTDFDYQSLYQTLLVTINMIENALLKEHKLLVYNYYLFKFKHENKFDFEYLQQVLQRNINNSSSDKTYDNTIKLMSDEYNVYLHGSYFHENDRQFRVYWNGTLQFGYQILMHMSEGIIYVNDLIGYQRFTIKWFVAKILLGIQYFLILFQRLLNPNTNEIENKNKMKNYVQEFDKLDFPNSVETLLVDTVQAILDTMKPESTHLEYDFSVQLIDKNLVSLDIHPTKEITNPTINEIVTSVHNDLGLCSTFLNKLSVKTDNALISYDLSLSPIESTKSYEDFVIPNEASSISGSDD